MWKPLETKSKGIGFETCFQNPTIIQDNFPACLFFLFNSSIIGPPTHNLHRANPSTRNSAESATRTWAFPHHHSAPDVTRFSIRWNPLFCMTQNLHENNNVDPSFVGSMKHFYPDIENILCSICIGRATLNYRPFCLALMFTPKRPHFETKSSHVHCQTAANRTNKNLKEQQHYSKEQHQNFYFSFWHQMHEKRTQTSVLDLILPRSLTAHPYKFTSTQKGKDCLPIIVFQTTLPRTNIAPENGASRNFIFQASIFRCYVSFREGIKSNSPNLRTFTKKLILSPRCCIIDELWNGSIRLFSIGVVWMTFPH